MSAPIQLQGPYHRRRTAAQRIARALAQAAGWLLLATGLLVGLPFTAGAISALLLG